MTNFLGPIKLFSQDTMAFPQPIVKPTSTSNNLSRYWQETQAERDETRQTEILCSTLFAEFMTHCHSCHSATFRHTFGDGTGLLSVVCRIFVRDSRRAIANGADGLSRLLNTSTHVVQLSLLSTLLDSGFHGGCSMSASEDLTAMMRICALHNIASVVVNLHNAFLTLLTSDPTSLSGISPEVVAAEQKHLSLLQLLASHLHTQVLSDMQQANGFMSVISTLGVCYTFPFWASASLTAIAHECALFFLSKPDICSVLAARGGRMAAMATVLEAVGDSHGEGLDVAMLEEGTRAQKLNSLYHCFDLLRFIKHELPQDEQLPIQYPKLVATLLSLQHVMAGHKRRVETLISVYVKLAYQSKRGGKCKAPETKKKGFLKGVLNTAKGLLGQDASRVNPNDGVVLVLHDPECIEALCDFVTNATSKEPRLWVAIKLFEVLASDMPPNLTSTMLDIVCCKVASYDLPLIIQLLRAVEHASGSINVSSCLTKICTGCLSLEPEVIHEVFTYYTALAHRGPPLLDKIACCGVIETSCTVIKDIIDRNGVDSGNAQPVFTLWKVLAQSPLSLSRFAAADAPRCALMCALVTLDTPEGAALVASSRGALVSLVAAQSMFISVLLGGLLNAHTKDMWKAELSSLLVAFVVVLFGAPCKEEAVMGNAIEICLSLLQSVRKSPRYEFDTYLVGTALSMLMPYVRWSEAGRMLAAAIPDALAGTKEMINLLKLVACGGGMLRENVSLLMDVCNGSVHTDTVTEFQNSLIESSSGSTLLCEHVVPIHVLCKWFREGKGEKDVLQSTIAHLVRAYRTPLLDADFAVLVAENEWYDLVPCVGDLSPILSHFILPDDGDCDAEVVAKVARLWHSAVVPSSFSSAGNAISRNSISFCGSGCARGFIKPSAEWPPQSGFSIVGWFQYTTDADDRRNASFAAANDPTLKGSSVCFLRRIPIWSMKWDYEGSSWTRISLHVEVDLDVVVLEVEGPSSKSRTNYTFPAFAPDQWCHVAVLFTRGPSEMGLVLNGIPMKRTTCPYPCVQAPSPGAILSSSCFELCVGFDEETKIVGANVSMGPLQVFDCSLVLDTIQSLMATPVYQRDIAQSAMGNYQLWVNAPIVGNPLRCRLSSCDPATTASNDGFKMRAPEGAAVLSLHPTNTAFSTCSLSYLDNKVYSLVNMATSDGDLYLYGRHTTPPNPGISYHPLSLLSNLGLKGAVSQFLDSSRLKDSSSGNNLAGNSVWASPSRTAPTDPQRSLSLTPNIHAQLLEVFGVISCEGSDFTELSRREIYLQLASVIDASPREFTLRGVVLPSFLSLVAPYHHFTKVDTVGDSASPQLKLRDLHSRLVVNGPLTEMLLMNWSFLTRLETSTCLELLDAIQGLVSPSNPYHRINAWRLRRYGMLDGFVWGLTRFYIQPFFLDRVRSILQDFAMCLVWDTKTFMELATFVAATVPSGDVGAHLEKLGSTLGPMCAHQLHDARNVVLAALLHTSTNLPFNLDFAAVLPLSWFVAVTDRNSHPVSAALALRIFAGIYNRSSTFRSRCEKSSILKALSRTLQHHAHQQDVVFIVGQLVVGHTSEIFEDRGALLEGPLRGQITHVALVPLLISVLKALSMSVQEQLSNRSPGASAFEFDRSLKVSRSPRLRALVQVALFVGRVKRALESRNGFSGKAEASEEQFSRSSTPMVAGVSSSATAGYATSDVSNASGLGSSRSSMHQGRDYEKMPVPKEEIVRRCGLCVKLLRFLASVATRYDSVATILFAPSSQTTPQGVDAVSWAVLASMSRVDYSDGAANKRSGDLDSDSDDDNFIGISSSLGVCDAHELPAPRFPDLLDAALALYGVMEELSLGVHESYSVSAQGIKTCTFVALLHQILTSCPAGVGDQAEAWFHCHVLNMWLTNASRIIRRTPLVGDEGANVSKNAVQTSIYCIERLMAGLPSPPRATASFAASLIAIIANSDNVKILKSLLVDWGLYVLSSDFHGWNAQRLAISRDLTHEFRPLILNAPFANSEMTKLFVVRLLEVTLALLQGPKSLKDPHTFRLGDLWASLFAVNRSSPVFSLLLVDGGVGTGRPRIDLLHGGFDRLYSSTNHEGFLTWFVDNKIHISSILSNNPGMKVEAKLIAANPKRHQKWVSRSAEETMNSKSATEIKLDELYVGFLNQLEKCAQTGSSVDADLLTLVRGRTLVVPDVVVYESNTAESVPAALRERPFFWSSYLSRTAVVSKKQLLQPSHAFNVDVELGATPIAALMAHSGSTWSTLIPDVSESGSSFSSVSGIALRPSAKSIVERVIGCSGQETKDSPVVWAGNVYNICGNESHVCSMFLTRSEIVLISSAQISKEGELFVASLETHKAASRSQRKGVMGNMIRKFLPRAPIPVAALSGQSLAMFRHSQYYRQLRTEALGQQSESRVWTIPLALMTEIHHRRFQHQAAALEIVREDGAKHMLVFLDGDLVMSRDARQSVAHLISELASHIQVDTSANKRNRIGALQKRWQRRQVSNYDFLLAINDAASRTTADLTQYPVLPWVLSVYDEVHVELDNLVYFRDLSKPVGALTEHRRNDVRVRYKEWLDDMTPPFHFGTHYSTSAVVMYFLVRVQPFTQYSVAYQGGRLDVADRLFHSVQEAWISCSGAAGRDVKELIPEFFSIPDFAVNANNVELGSRRDGVTLGDVVLPPWACGSAERFVFINREALESDAVSASLHSWIDLIFGSKQQGDEAVEACNVFHHLTYEEGLEQAMTKASSEEDRKAIVASVDNFGLTPKQLFKIGHPRRGPVLSPPRQELFLAATTMLAKRSTTPSFPDAQCAGESIVALQEVDGMGPILCASTTSYRATRNKSGQHFVVDATRSLAVNFRAKDQGMSVLPPIEALGLGSCSAFANSASGNFVFMGMTKGRIVVFTRSSWTSRFSISKVLHLQCASRVKMLVPLPNGLLLASTDSSSHLSLWHVSKSGADKCFGVNVSLSSIPDGTPVKAACRVPCCMNGFLVAKERSLYILTRSGEVLSGVHIDSAPQQLPNVSSVSSMDFSNHNAVNVGCCGHIDGTLSFWSIVTNTAPNARAMYGLSFHSAISVDTSPITAIQCDTGAGALSITVGCKSGACYVLTVPQQAEASYDA